MTYIKKGFFLIVGTALMVILLLAAGGVHLLPEYIFKSLMENELWSTVGGMFSMMLLPGAVVGFAACHSRILGLVEFAVFVVCGFIGGLNLWWIITAVLFSVLAYIIAPAVIYVAWAIIALVFLILSAVAISAVPEGGNGGIDWTWYNMRRNQGMSHNEAFNDARIHASQNR